MKRLKIIMVLVIATFISSITATAQTPALAPDTKETGKTISPQPPPATLPVDKLETKQAEKTVTALPDNDRKPPQTAGVILPAKNYDELNKPVTIKLPVNDVTPIPVKREASAPAADAKPKQLPVQQQQKN